VVARNILVFIFAYLISDQTVFDLANDAEMKQIIAGNVMKVGSFNCSDVRVSQIWYPCIKHMSCHD